MKTLFDIRSHTGPTSVPTATVTRGEAVATALLAAGLTGLAATRPWLRGGARPAEVAAALAGDDIVPHPVLEATHAVTVDAPSDVVWPWIVQVGRQRGGFYGADRLLNDGAPSADRIHAELQHLEVGDAVADGFGPFSYRVACLDRGTAVVFEACIHPVTGRPLRAEDCTADRPWVRFTWALVLRPESPRSTRLIMRVRYVCPPTAWIRAVVETYEIADAAFAYLTLHSIARRAEEAHVADSADATPDGDAGTSPIEEAGGDSAQRATRARALGAPGAAAEAAFVTDWAMAG